MIVYRNIRTSKAPGHRQYLQESPHFVADKCEIKLNHRKTGREIYPLFCFALAKLR